MLENLHSWNYCLEFVSHQILVESGVPQGSELGPLLFNFNQWSPSNISQCRGSLRITSNYSFLSLTFRDDIARLCSLNLSIGMLVSSGKKIYRFTGIIVKMENEIIDVVDIHKDIGFCSSEIISIVQRTCKTNSHPTNLFICLTYCFLDNFF